MNPGASDERRGGAEVFLSSDAPLIVDVESRHDATSSFGLAEAIPTGGSGACDDDARVLATCLVGEGYNQASAYHCVSCMVNSMLGACSEMKGVCDEVTSCYDQRNCTQTCRGDFSSAFDCVMKQTGCDGCFPPAAASQSVSPSLSILLGAAIVLMRVSFR